MRAWLVRATAFALAVACGDPSHVFMGRLYRDDRDCVATTSSLDTVEGEDPGTCAPACLVQKNYDGGGTSVYVSTMCPPYPHFMDASGSDPRCAPALAANARNDTCLANGGSTSPLPRDGGTD